ncbi:thrombospondin type 3 repeat-containing protein [Haliea sp. E17]|uniref:thrombospondin type 3 repeat-containing protein n=1 Tax=Haliea sp. E17 TaxID=3401576 RepID=UPI003AAFEEB6
MSRTLSMTAFLVALLACIALPRAHAQDNDPATAPIPDLDALLADTRRALYLEFSLLADGTATLLDVGVTDVPPPATDDDPPMLMFRLVDREGQTLGEQNIWDPLYEYQQTEVGETVIRLPEAVGFFQVPFDHRINHVVLLDQQTDPPRELAVFDTQPVIERFCVDEPEDTNCAGFEPADTDGDNVPDAADRCPDTPAGEPVDSEGCSARQQDADNDGVSDALDACPGTRIPESVPTEVLRPNHYALTTVNVADPLVFESSNQTPISTADTAGCSCEQIIDALSLGQGHSKYGCSPGVLSTWIDTVN